MKIGFDISQTGKTKAGCGYFAHSLIDTLRRRQDGIDYVLFPSFGDFFFDPTLLSDRTLLSEHAKLGPVQATQREAAAFWTAADLESRISGIDIVHSNNYWSPAAFTRTKLIYTLYDLSFLVEPDWTTEANRVGCFRGAVRAAVNADWMVAISQASKDHFLRVFPSYDPERIRVIYPWSRFSGEEGPGAVPAALAGRVQPGGFLLSIGTIEPRKNHRRLVQSYAAYLAADGADIPLVLAGGAGWLMTGFEAELARLGVADRVIITGYVSDEEMIWLYRNCMAHVYVSLFEGFGLPVLEGMRFGAPTLASDIAPLREIVGEAGIPVDPMSNSAIAAGIATIVGLAQRETLGLRGQARARMFDRETSADQLVSLYRTAHESPKRDIAAAA